MKELSWERPSSDVPPEKSQIVMADIEDWNSILASNFGFPNLIPTETPDKLYHIAVARNKDGEIIGAKLLEETVPGLTGSNQENLIFLTERAQRIFGLTIRSQDDS